jgi:hypothetical protein
MRREGDRDKAVGVPIQGPLPGEEVDVGSGGVGRLIGADVIGALGVEGDQDDILRPRSCPAGERAEEDS